ncbi:1416_t:CDS:1, partial [Gigaspora margarita]
CVKKKTSKKKEKIQAHQDLKKEESGLNWARVWGNVKSKQTI